MDLSNVFNTASWSCCFLHTRGCSWTSSFFLSLSYENNSTFTFGVQLFVFRTSVCLALRWSDLKSASSRHSKTSRPLSVRWQVFWLSSFLAWRGGKLLVWDFTCVRRLSADKARQDGASVATIAEAKKNKKYEDLAPQCVFQPVTVETLGGSGDETLTLIREVSHRISERQSQRNFVFIFYIYFSYLIFWFVLNFDIVTSNNKFVYYWKKMMLCYSSAQATWDLN